VTAVKRLEPLHPRLPVERRPCLVGPFAARIRVVTVEVARGRGVPRIRDLSWRLIWPVKLRGWGVRVGGRLVRRRDWLIGVGGRLVRLRDWLIGVGGRLTGAGRRLVRLRG